MLLYVSPGQDINAMRLAKQAHQGLDSDVIFFSAEHGTSPLRARRLDRGGHYWYLICGAPSQILHVDRCRVRSSPSVR